MFQQNVHRRLRAIHQVQHARRKSDSIHQLENTLHGERHFFRGLQNERIPTGNRIRQEPERNHCRKIKGCDRGHNSQRLADHDFVDPARHVFEVVALHQRGDPAGDLYILDAAPQFGTRFRQCLAVLGRGDTGNFVEMLFQQLLQLEQILNAVFRRRRPPCWQSLAGCGNCRVYFGCIRNRNCRQNFLRRRIYDIQKLGALRRLPLAANVVLDGIYLGCTQNTHILYRYRRFMTSNFGSVISSIA